MESSAQELQKIPIGAVVLAAGQSKRMGQPKMTLPWGETTVVGRVVSVLLHSGLVEVVVVTGGARQAVETALQNFPIRTVINPHHKSGEMLASVKTGLSSLPEAVQAALIVLGDQPQIEHRVVKSILEIYQKSRSLLVVPSYQYRRGHPWLIDRVLWPAVFELQSPATLRDFLQEQDEIITYITVNTSSILQDLDTPEDYRRYRPSNIDGSS